MFQGGKKNQEKIKIKIEKNWEVVVFRTSYTKNIFFFISYTKKMSNQWFISIMSRSYSFNLVLVIFF